MRSHWVVRSSDTPKKPALVRLSEHIRSFSLVQLNRRLRKFVHLQGLLVAGFNKWRAETNLPVDEWPDLQTYQQVVLASLTCAGEFKRRKIPVNDEIRNFPRIETGVAPDGSGVIAAA